MRRQETSICARAHRRGSRALAALASALLTGCAATQPIGVESLAPGMRVRVTHPDDVAVDGRVVRRVNGSLEVRTIETQELRRVALSEKVSVELYSGRDHVRGALLGTAAGVPLGVVGGMLCARYCSHTSSGARVYAPMTGVTLGAIVGGGFGLLFFSTDRWQPVQLR